MMEGIAGMMQDLDVPSQRDQQVYVFHLKHGDPYEVSQVLQGQFQSSTSSRGGSSSGSGSTQSTLQLRAAKYGDLNQRLRQYGGLEFLQRQRPAERAVVAAINES